MIRKIACIHNLLRLSIDMLATVVNVPSTTSGSLVITKDGVITGANFSDIPVRTVCPQCRKPIMTQVTNTIGLGTWLLALVLLLLPPLCFLPFFINSCKDTEHRCPNCGNVVGLKKVDWMMQQPIFFCQAYKRTNFRTKLRIIRLEFLLFDLFSFFQIKFRW